MGTGISVNCSECGYSKTFHLGVGLLYFPFRKELVEDLINNERIKGEIIDRLEDGEKPKNFKKALMKCPECGVAYEKFYVKFENTKNNKKYETNYRCNNCNEELELIEMDKVEKTKCPRCNGKSLRIFNRLEWD